MSELSIFENVLAMQLQAHGVMEPQDVVKLCYQAANGAEHLLEDLSGAERYFYEEYASVSPTDEPLFEPISRDVYRANLGAWKKLGLPAQWLFRMFTGTVFQSGGRERMLSFLTAAEQVLLQSGFDMGAWHNYLVDYVRRGMPPVRHTAAYRQAERPAYRIVHVDYVHLMPVLRRLAETNKRPYVIAIDGKAGAGKSTFAEKLCRVLDSGMVYMDDFFLPPALRTPERLEEIGGNVHYERFGEEVLHALHSPETFAYTRFDCSVMDYGERRQVSDSPWRIVEGSYSHHPALGMYADLWVYMDIDSETQMERILERNGPELAERFRKEWIPMENRYFDLFKIKERADITV